MKGLSLNQWLARVRVLHRRISGIDASISKEYFRIAQETKLQIGGGWCRKEGWLNTDLERLPEVMFMDATRPFPFAADTFDYLFSEHMIEHVPLESGVSMLRECHRVMRPSAVIRIVTPDLKAMFSLYNTPLTTSERNYLEYFCQAHLSKVRYSTVAVAINAQMRMWGHQFLYDENTLATIMKEVGFRNIVRKRLGQSDHIALQGIENEARYPAGLLDFESLALEGTK